LISIKSDIDTTKRKKHALGIKLKSYDKIASTLKLSCVMYQEHVDQAEETLTNLNATLHLIDMYIKQSPENVSLAEFQKNMSELVPNLRNANKALEIYHDAIGTAMERNTTKMRSTSTYHDPSKQLDKMTQMHSRLSAPEDTQVKKLVELYTSN
jgi:hypothetical protein